MTYKTKCNGHCTSRIDAQAETIHKLREESRKKTEALIKASKQIAQLQGEKRDLTGALNLTSREMEYYRADYVRRSQPVGRADQNWDSRPREESWEL